MWFKLHIKQSFTHHCTVRCIDLGAETTHSSHKSLAFMLSTLVWIYTCQVLDGPQYIRMRYPLVVLVNAQCWNIKYSIARWNFLSTTSAPGYSSSNLRPTPPRLKSAARGAGFEYFLRISIRISWSAKSGFCQKNTVEEELGFRDDYSAGRQLHCQHRCS